MPSRHDLIDGVLVPAEEGQWVRYDEWLEIERIREVAAEQLREMMSLMRARAGEE